MSDCDAEQDEHAGRYQVKAFLRLGKQQQATSDHEGVRGERKHSIKEEVRTGLVRGTSPNC